MIGGAQDAYDAMERAYAFDEILADDIYDPRPRLPTLRPAGSKSVAELLDEHLQVFFNDLQNLLFTRQY